MHKSKRSITDNVVLSQGPIAAKLLADIVDSLNVECVVNLHFFLGFFIYSDLRVLRPISGLSLLILQTAQVGQLVSVWSGYNDDFTRQTVKTNKEECVHLGERIYELLCAIINICRDTVVELPSILVNNITQLSEYDVSYSSSISLTHL
jgi:hypothetical protein